ncbi:DUF2807 domain-containing protein [uncultured Algibacter sp.]|uniref:GIN domain-containing protein n=1 Tax=uncultured Algibacter sp. TaxID=298659 RepID=UPI00263776DC|nr:DUF2807 domain-containing protein [uncultured Algibacter sp.]
MTNKKILFAFLMPLMFSTAVMAQKGEKIKGNRNVITKQTDIDAFHTIALDEDFEVEIIYNKNPSVEIETDENLHDVIEFQVRDSVLTFNKNMRIVSKKRLNIRVAYNHIFRHIKVSDDAEINSLTTVDLQNGTLKTIGSSKAALTITTNSFNFESSEKSKVKLNLTAESCSINMFGNSKLEALINAPNIKASLFQRADANVEGVSKTADIDLDNNARFNGKNLTISTCNIICEINSDAYLEVLDDITIEAAGSSSIYLYENPKIIINKLTDTSKLQKKVK